MKKSILTLLALATIASAAAFGACDNSSDSAGAGGDVSQEQTGVQRTSASTERTSTTTSVLTINFLVAVLRFLSMQLKSSRW